MSICVLRNGVVTTAKVEPCYVVTSGSCVWGVFMAEADAIAKVKDLSDLCQGVVQYTEHDLNP